MAVEPIITDPKIDREKAKELFNWVGDKVVEWNMVVPAIIFLETSRPLNVIGAHSVFFFQPLANIFIDVSQAELFAQLMLERENVERLITLIEEKAAQKKKAPPLPPPNKALPPPEDQTPPG